MPASVEILSLRIGDSRVREATNISGKHSSLGRRETLTEALHFMFEKCPCLEAVDVEVAFWGASVQPKEGRMDEYDSLLGPLGRGKVRWEAWVPES